MAIALDIRKNDEVQVTGGRDKGKGGGVLGGDPHKGVLFVEHVNMIKRHTRPNPAKQIRGGILEKEGPIHISNVSLRCADCNKPTRIQPRKNAEGKTVRVCAKCSKVLDK